MAFETVIRAGLGWLVKKFCPACGWIDVRQSIFKCPTCDRELFPREA